MNSGAITLSLDEVLDAFSSEADVGKETLERYLSNYPGYALELVELAYELALPVEEETAPLSDGDKTLIDDGLSRIQQALSAAVAAPFESLSVGKSRELASKLDVPRQVIVAFREGRVVVESVPQTFLGELAEALGGPVEQVIAFLQSARPQLVRSHKSDIRPEAQAPVTFEQLLIEAGVPAEKRARLLAEQG